MEQVPLHKRCRKFDDSDILTHSQLGRSSTIALLVDNSVGHIREFSITQGESIDVLASAFGNGLVAGTDATGIFDSSANNTFGSGVERFHFNASTHNLLFESNASPAGGTQVALAVLENGGTVDATHIHIV